jgi:hypothetical protein
MAKSKRFQRKPADRPYRKVFYLFTEGAKTEPTYFNILQKICHQHVCITIKSHRTKSDLPHVLNRAKKFIQEEKPNMEFSEFWLVVDVDNRTKSQFAQLQKWTEERSNYYLAISNPKFEYWLLLHFEPGNGISSSEHCSRQLIEHMPYYQKNNLDEKKLLARLSNAIQNAKEKYSQCENDCFAGNCSMVYKLVEKIVNN